MISDHPDKRPVIKLLPGRHKRVSLGHPWIFSNEIDQSSLPTEIQPGQLVTLVTNFDEPVGVCYYNPHTLIAARMIDRRAQTKIDEAFILGRLKRALGLRDKLFGEPYYRLVHAEADGLPGLVIDRFGKVFVLRIGTQGALYLKDLVVAGLQAIEPDATIVVRQSPSHEQENLTSASEVIGGQIDGQIDGPIEGRENGAIFFADVVEGQKTGWFYDQRQNRNFVQKLAHGKRVLDVYSFTGGFAIQAALGGAAEVLAIDRSEGALSLAQQAAEANKVADICKFEEQEAFAFFEKCQQEGRTFDIVIADPPAFIKSKKDLQRGAKGYRKLTHQAASCVEPGGFLMIASCSHHMDAPLFWEQVRMGLAKGGRTGRIIRQSGAGPDHPLHPFLPESAYLTALLLQLD